MEIERILETVAEEERAIRKNDQETLKKDWQQAIQHKYDRDNAVVPESEPGLASAQRFVGEDTFAEDRKRLQREQMRNWTQQELDEKSRQVNVNRVEDAKYHEMMCAIADIRESIEKEEQDMRYSLKQNVNQANSQLAQQQRYQRQRENRPYAQLESQEILQATTLQLPTDRALAVDGEGRINRRDMFRGYSDAQRRRILQENEDIIRQK